MSRLGPISRRRAALLAAAAIALLAVAVAFRWWYRYVEDRLGRWAAGELARRTGGAYRLVLSGPSFRPLAGSISFDSAIVTTDSVRSRRRDPPLPALAWRAHRCRVNGLDVPRLLLRRSFVARELGCRRAVADIALVSGAGEGAAPPRTRRPWRTRSRSWPARSGSPRSGSPRSRSRV